MRDRLRRWWCRLNDHELGERSLGYDPAGKIVVFAHVCFCGLYFIDNWYQIDTPRAGK